MECYRIKKYINSSLVDLDVGQIDMQNISIVKIKIIGKSAEVYFSDGEMMFVNDVDFAYFRPIK